MKIGKTSDDFKKIVGPNLFVIEYKKKGTDVIRKAFGVCNLDFIPRDFVPKGKKPEDEVNIVNYFDLEKGDWRSFIVENLVNIVSIIPTKRASAVPDENGTSGLSHKDHQKLRMYEELERILEQRKLLNTSAKIFVRR